MEAAVACTRDLREGEALIGHGPIGGPFPTVVVTTGEAYDAAETRFNWQWEADNADVHIAYATRHGIRHYASGPVHQVRCEVASWRTGHRAGPRLYRRYIGRAAVNSGHCTMTLAAVLDNVGADAVWRRTNGERWREIAADWQVPVRAVLGWSFEYRLQRALEAALPQSRKR
ncbi:hypothetical protein [Nocardia testacea]|uniref:hypothetical protein n=1 Tax=Nocardia testacea TaxID=248551 RepID=UPI0033C4BD87